MKICKLSKIKEERQDGAVYNGYLFSFNYKGECTVYQMDALESCTDTEAEAFSEFTLDKSDIIVPHSNSVMFGSEYYDDKDEFPLLYTNIYNNYSASDDKLKGVCLVYRLQRFGSEFKTTLVQMIEISFTDDEELWCSPKSAEEDKRPYGNFTIDTQKSVYYAFTMRDASNSTRYFSFDLPKLSQGELSEKYNVRKVILKPENICDYFDCDYHHYIQGACCHNGKIYSLEGFTDNFQNPPAIRIIDTKSKKEVYFKKFGDIGLSIEPEMIDFEGDICYYGDHNGNMYKLFFND